MHLFYTDTIGYNMIKERNSYSVWVWQEASKKNLPYSAYSSYPIYVSDYALNNPLEVETFMINVQISQCFINSFNHNISINK